MASTGAAPTRVRLLRVGESALPEPGHKGQDRMAAIAYPETIAIVLPEKGYQQTHLTPGRKEVLRKESREVEFSSPFDRGAFDRRVTCVAADPCGAMRS